MHKVRHATVKVIDGGKIFRMFLKTEFPISGGTEWTPHKVEMAVWTYYILREFKPEALENLPEASDRRVASTEPAETESGPANGNGVNGEVSNGDAEAAEVTPEAEASPAPPTDQAPEVPEASEANTNGTNGSEAPAEAAEASDKVPCSESEVGFLKDKILSSYIAFFFSHLLLSIELSET